MERERYFRGRSGSVPRTRTTSIGPVTTHETGPNAGKAPDPRLLRAQQMCDRRAFREREVSIKRIVGEVAREAARNAKRSVGAAEAWEQAMPRALVAETWIESASAAQLVIGVGSSAAAYAVDRALREGALAALRTAMHAPALRVRTRVGRMPGQ